MRALAFFITLSVLLHGTFFLQEWLLLGAGMTFITAWFLWRGLRKPLVLELSFTDVLFVGLILLSLAGLMHPVKVSEGWLDAVRWLTLWMVYRIARQIQDERNQRVILSWLEILGVILAVIGWIPTLSRFWPEFNPYVEGRLTSLFGYSNALAAYYAAVLLLRPRSPWIRTFIFISLLNTGSRAAMGMYMILWGVREYLWLKRTKGIAKRWSKGSGKGLGVERLCLFMVLILSFILTIRLNPQAVEHLLNWRVSSSVGERLLYIFDGLHLAWLNKGLPQAGGWFAFPRVQGIPYWVNDPHSLGIRVLLHQGLLGLLGVLGWGIWILRSGIRKFTHSLWENYEAAFIPPFCALIFLGLHALLDADFLFGALGVQFWVLYGMFFSFGTQGKTLSFNFIRNRGIDSYYRKSRSILLDTGLRVLLSAFFIGIGFTLLATFVHPGWIKPEKNLALDQTKNTLRREIALQNVKSDGSQGLPAMDEVLVWEKFDLRAYEWAQGIVFEEAEKRKDQNPEEALELYQWVVTISGRIEGIGQLSPLERRLWPEYERFRPSELSKLLTDYAKERQLTLR